MAVIAVEAAPGPASLLAVTVREYTTPLVRPLMAQLSKVVVQDGPPGLKVAVYDVAGPVVGAVHDGVTLVSPLTTTTATGAEGGLPMTLQLNAALDAEIPRESVTVRMIPDVVPTAAGAVPVINPVERLSVSHGGRFDAE